MKKTPNFKVGDKVFAKVKGYPPWPAHVIAVNAKKYNVEFYGTGETGIIKAEDLAYYLKNKEKFQKPLKRKDYVDAFEQIEAAVKKDGGDGSSVDDVSINESSDSFNTSNASNLSVNTPKVVKKPVKRKRSSSDKVMNETLSPPKKKASEKAEQVGTEDNSNEHKQVIASKRPGGRVKEVKITVETENSKEFEFVPINDSIDNASEIEGTEDIVKPSNNERSETLDFKIEIIGEKTLKNNITYANYIKEKEAKYKAQPVEPREDYISQVLPVKLPSGIMAGIKLHTEWPLKFENEYARAIYDESVALRVIEEKQKIESGDTTIINNPELCIPNIEMSADDVTESLYLKDISGKRARIDRLKIEADLMELDSKIKNCLGLDKADPKQAVEYLEAIRKIVFDDLMLKKHPHVFEMVRRLRKYVGNTKEWNLSEESLTQFTTQAEKVREKAEAVYVKFKNVVKVPPNSASFWEGFNDLVVQFRSDCKDMTEAQVYLLCAEPLSRQAFFDHLDEIESEKENSSGVANSESEPVAKGANETPAAES